VEVKMLWRTILGQASPTRALRGLALGLALCAAAPAQAGVNDELEAARAALIAGDSKAALAALQTAQASAQSSTELVLNRQLAQIFYLRGVALRVGGDKEAGNAEWRQALVIHNQHEWDPALIADNEVRDFFEALRSEVRGRPKVDALVPAQVGAAKLFIDGERAEAGQKVLEGLHLSQVACPEDVVYGQWTRFDKKTKWLKLCPKGVDTTVVVAAAEDDFGMPNFGDEPSEPVVAAVDPQPSDPKAGEGGEPLSIPAGGGEKLIGPRRVSWPLVAAGGGTLLASGATLLVANARNNAFYSDAYSDVAAMEQAQARTNRAGYLGYSLGGVGVALCAAAVIPW
jgi:hypothetical protein